VRWNDGKESVLADVAANQVVVIDYTQSTRRKDTTPVQEFLFREATNQVFSEPVFHKENEFNEYKEQVLLPHMFSRSGPFMSVADVNNDNQEDVFVGGAAGSAGQLFLQKNGKLVRKVVKDFEQDKSYEDIGALFFDANQDSHPDLYVVSGGSEFREGHELYQDRLYINDGSGNFARTALPKIGSSGSCVVANDINGDGKLDLFVGGMVTMGAYPKAPRSYLLINEGGKFSDKTNELAPTLAEVGMVKSAIWTDLTGDGVAELVVVGEWMAVKVFENEGGKLNDISDALGLAETHGWWNSVAAEDLNGDGRIDLVLGNQGDNYKFKPSEEKPLQVFAKDFDGNNTNDIFLAKMNKDTLVPVRGRECTSVQMPMISQKFPSFRAFAGADLNQILGPDMANAMHLKATIFSSIILINEGNGFKKMKLPVDAQFSAINSIIIEDFNEDGHKDILIAGNKFDSEVETTPADASQGLLLLGLGNFEFRSVRAMESGFFVPYNVKDTKRIKLGKEWATLVSSNNDLLRVFKQTKSKR